VKPPWFSTVVAETPQFQIFWMGEKIQQQKNVEMNPKLISFFLVVFLCCHQFLKHLRQNGSKFPQAFGCFCLKKKTNATT